MAEGEIKSNKAVNRRVMDRKDTSTFLSVSQSVFYNKRNIRLMIEELSFITEQQRPLTRKLRALKLKRQK